MTPVVPAPVGRRRRRRRRFRTGSSACSRACRAGAHRRADRRPQRRARPGERHHRGTLSHRADRRGIAPDRACPTGAGARRSGCWDNRSHGAPSSRCAPTSKRESGTMPMSRGRRHVARAIAAVLLAVAVSGCATSGNFRRARSVARAGDWDTAVAYFTQGRCRTIPIGPTTRSRSSARCWRRRSAHLDAAREFDARATLENALRRVPQGAASSSPANSHAIAAARRDRTAAAREGRGDAHAARDRRDARAGARQTAEGPILNPASQDAAQPEVRHQHRDPGHPEVHRRRHRHQRHLSTGDQPVVARPITLDVDGRHARAGACNLVMTANQLFYKVLNERTILVIPDTRAEAPAVRGAGHPHLLPVARRPAGDRADW